MGYIGSVVPFPSRPAALGPKSLLPIYPMCARVSCATTDLLHSLCIPFHVHITPFIGQLVSTIVVAVECTQTHEKRFLPTTESV